MFLALREMGRSVLKFGLLAAATGLLVFLLMFLGTLSGTLLGSYIGAIENAEADLLTFSVDSEANVQASRLTEQDVQAVSAVPGVEDAAGMTETTLTVEVAGERQDLSLWGTEPGRPGDVPVTEGRPAGVGEVVIDRSAKSLGFEIGTTITLVETGRTLEVVGFTGSRQYSVLPTGYTPAEEWNAIFFATYPGVPVAPVNIVATTVAPSQDTSEVASAITAANPNLDPLTPVDAGASAPGVSSIETSFNLIVGITFGIVIVVIGFFFTILAVQKQRSFALLRAVGASRRLLATAITVQVFITITIGTIIAIGVLALAAATSSDAFPLAVDTRSILITALAVIALSVLSGAFAIRRALSVDPVAAAQGTA